MPDADRTRRTQVDILLLDAFADWEVGYFAAASRDFFAADIRYYSPNGGTVTSEGGLVVQPHGRFADLAPGKAKALVICGSGGWQKPDAPSISDILHRTLAAGAVVGAICGGTLPVARADLFDDREHTSNALDFLTAHAASYAGHARYRDVNDAVVSADVISAPASAPVAFARALLAQIFPEHPALPPTLAMLSNAR
jgi:putative intracellular protease/amidase